LFSNEGAPSDFCPSSGTGVAAPEPLLLLLLFGFVAAAGALDGPAAASAISSPRPPQFLSFVPNSSFESIRELEDPLGGMAGEEEDMIIV
jgi:hypothetical protein